ncbi:MAG: DUF2752 domain-containing protein [Flavobacteriales bacterium]
MPRWGWWIAAPVALLFLGHLYLHDPEKGGFLSCPFRLLTGLLCPGCGSQRALHDLMHLRIAEAFWHNALLVASIPLLGIHWGYSAVFPSAKPLSAYNQVVLAWAALAIGWGIVRNLPVLDHLGY